MNCEMCGEKFTPRDGNQKYCCDKCRERRNTIIARQKRHAKLGISDSRICYMCGKEFPRTNGNRKYCSDECREKAKREQRSLYNSKRYRGQKPFITTGEETDPYINLSNAIVFQAVQDYRKAVEGIEAEPFNYMAKKDIAQIERFIKSEWFEMISDIDPMTLIRHLHREVADGQAESKKTHQEVQRIEVPCGQD